MQYDGGYYANIGDFLRQRYLDYGFTRGTRQEVDFLVELLDLPADARILDVGCGAGRHSLELARRGMNAYGVDISAGLIEVARQQAVAEGLPAEFLVADARRLELAPEFDAALSICEGAFGLAGGDDDHRQVLVGIHRALRPGAPFVLTAINALSVARKVDPGASSFDPYTCTSVDRAILRNPEGATRKAEIYTTAFTYRELKWFLEEAGFQVEAGYGCVAGKFERKQLAVDDVELMMVARRI